MTRFAFPVRLLLLNQFSARLGGLGRSAAVIGVRTPSQQGLFMVGGTASDRLGPRTAILAGCALRAMGFGLFAIVESVTVVLAAALFTPAVRAYIALGIGLTSAGGVAWLHRRGALTPPQPEVAR